LLLYDAQSLRIVKEIAMSSVFKNIRKTWLCLLRAGCQSVFFVASAFSLVYFDFTLIAVIMAVSFLGGAWFCGWVCPFGSAQDWVSALGRRFFTSRLKVSPRVEKFLSWLRYLLLALSIAGFGYTAFLSRPYQNFSGLLAGHTAYVGWAAWSLLALFLASSLVIDRPFCRYFCLEGAQYGILSLGRLFTIKRNKSSCIGCGACDRACPSGITVSAHPHVRHPACINCMKCAAACPVQGCLTYSLVINRREK